MSNSDVNTKYVNQFTIIGVRMTIFEFRIICYVRR
jgi:hypothetical protein